MQRKSANKIIVLALVLLAILASGCSPSESAIQTAMAETQNAIPTSTTAPTKTATQTPTNTPQPTITPTESIKGVIPDMTVEGFITYLEEEQDFICEDPETTTAGELSFECNIESNYLENVYAFTIIFFSPDNEHIRAIALLTVTYNQFTSMNFGVGKLKEIIKSDQFSNIPRDGIDWIESSLEELMTSSSQLEINEEFSGIYYQITGKSTSYLILISATPF